MKARVTSGITLVFFLAAIVIFNHNFPLALNLAIALVSALSVHEIISALGFSKKKILLIPSILFSAALPLIEDFFYQQTAYFVYTVVLFGTLILCNRMVTFREVGVIYSMSLMIPSALETVISLRDIGGRHGMFYVIIAIFSAWIADTGAFLAGSMFGKHKLCPEISPKKTVEGVAGGFVLNVSAMLLFGYLFQVVYYRNSVSVSFPALLIIGAFGTVMSVLGDLSFSLIKRSCHIKDFSEMIPGHGGILDRFDSVIFEAPFVYLLVRILPIVLK